MQVKVDESCLTLCNPMDYPVHVILQARILKWVAFPFSRGSSHPRSNQGFLHYRWTLNQLGYKGSPYYTSSVQFSSVQSLSRVRLSATPRIAAHRASLSITISWSSLKLTSIKSVMPSHPRSSPSPPAPNPSQHHSLFQ